MPSGTSRGPCSCRWNPGRVLLTLVEYFAANYFLNKGYTLTATRRASGAPLGDMMVIVGTWLFGSYKAGAPSCSCRPSRSSWRSSERRSPA
jgi:hypothetical protein